MTGTVACGVALVLIAGCSMFGGGKKASGSSTSVFDVKPGECFQTPGAVKAELSSLTRLDCTKPHTEESYAVVKYQPAASSASGAPVSTSNFPGEDILTSFAQGSCAAQFTGYVGVNYLDSTLFFTYLLPSARGWEQNDDRNVICFVTTTGATLTKSVKGSKQ